MTYNYALTGEQLKAIKEVEKAMKAAAKAGVHFWDNYGILTAYNDEVIHCPVPDQSLLTQLDPRKVYYLDAKNFHAGNADDTLYICYK